jgi:hypothetical protein
MGAIDTFCRFIPFGGHPALAPIAVAVGSGGEGLVQAS